MAVEFVKVDNCDDGMRLDRWFKCHYPSLSFSHFQKKCRKGEIRINGKRVKSGERVKSGFLIRIPPLNLSVFNTINSSSTARLDVYNSKDSSYIRNLVIFENDNFLAINKPAGLASQGGTKISKNLDDLSNYLTKDNMDKPRLVHRLDKDTSGVILLGKNRLSTSKFTKALKGCQIKKIYIAFIKGNLKQKSGTIDIGLLKKTSKSNERVLASDDGKPAITDYVLLEKFKDDVSLLALSPRTGRTHQLRVHMAHLGCPILGDGKYGGKDAFVNQNADISQTQLKKLQLHALSICVPKEIFDGKKDIVINAKLPKHMIDTFLYFGVNEDDIEKHLKDYKKLRV